MIQKVSNRTFRNQLIEDVKICTDKKKSYEKLLENKTDEKETFKLLLLVDLAYLEKYITQTQVHADQSFRLCRYVAICGATLVLFSIVLGTTSRLLPMHPLEIAYLSAAAGIITQLISGIFFYFYNMTLKQLNDFHNKLESSRKVCASLFLQSLIDNTTDRDRTKLELIKFLTSEERATHCEQASEEKWNGKPHEAEIVPSNGNNRL